MSARERRAADREESRDDPATEGGGGRGNRPGDTTPGTDEDQDAYDADDGYDGGDDDTDDPATEGGGGRGNRPGDTTPGTDDDQDPYDADDGYDGGGGGFIDDVTATGDGEFELTDDFTEVLQ